MTEYLLNDKSHPVGLLDVTDPVFPDGSVVLRVGADKQFKTIADAVKAAHDGTVILVDAGTYTNDFVTTYAKLTIIGVGGMVNMVATVPPPNMKAIMTVDNDLNLQNFTFSGCAIPDSQGGNGAGIRFEAGKMVLTNDAFYKNQNGILSGAGASGVDNEVVINNCLFSDNGSGTGQTHNLYIGAIQSLTVTNSIFEGAVVGHELKSRALVNTITGNILRDGATGTASYELDLPNGGADVVTGNVFEKNVGSQNHAMVHFGGEGLPYAGSSLTLQGNTFVNDLGPDAIGVLNQSGIAVTLTDNTFDDVLSNKVVSGPAILTGNVNADGSAIADSASLDAMPGNTMKFTDAAAHSVVLDGTIAMAAQGGAGLMTVVAAVGFTVTSGGSGGINYSETGESSYNKVTTAAGSASTIHIRASDVIDSGGTDTIFTGVGDTTGIARGNATISVGSGFDRWTIDGNTTMTTYAGGSPFVTVDPTGHLTMTGAVPATQIQNNGGKVDVNVSETDTTGAAAPVQFSIAGGSVIAKVGSGLVSVTTAGGAQGSTMSFGAGTVNVQSAGNDTIWAGGANTSVSVFGNAAIHAGTGSLAVYGSGSAATVYGSGGTVTLDGNTGGITYYGGDKNNTVVSTLSHDTLIGGAGRMTILGGLSEAVTGGSGGINYVAPAGSGSITTAAGSTNFITMNDGTVDSWGTDRITCGTASVTLNVHGDSVITGSTGRDFITLSGKDTLVGRNADMLTVTSGANVSVNVANVAFVTETDATMRLAVGSGAQQSSVTLTGSGQVQAWASSGITVATAAGTANTINLGTGTVTLNSWGSDTVKGNHASSTVNIYGSQSQVWANDGTMIVNNLDHTVGDTLIVHGSSGQMVATNYGDRMNFFGGSGSAIVNGGGGTLNVVGGSGSLNVSGGDAGMVFVAGTGASSVALSTGANGVVFGQGNTVVNESAWGKANLFEFMSGRGAGNDVINGFRTGVDHITLVGGVGVQSTSVANGAASMVMTDGSHLTLLGVTNTSGVFYTQH